MSAGMDAVLLHGVSAKRSMTKQLRQAFYLLIDINAPNIRPTKALKLSYKILG